VVIITPPDSCAMIGVRKGHAIQRNYRSAYLPDPAVPSVGCSHDCAEVTYSGPGIHIRKGNTLEPVGRSACLANPRLALICCSDDSSLLTNSSSIVSVSKGNMH